MYFSLFFGTNIIEEHSRKLRAFKKTTHVMKTEDRYWHNKNLERNPSEKIEGIQENYIVQKIIKGYTGTPTMGL